VALVVVVTPAVYGQIVTRGRDGNRVRVEVFRGEGGRIGVTVRDIETADAAKKPPSTGVVIEQVRSDSPAEKAGLKAGDVVVEFDGLRVRSVTEFTRVVRETPIARTVKLAYVRDGKRTETDIKVEDRGDRYFDTDVIGPRIETRLREIGPRIERELQDLGPRLERRFEELGPEIERRLERLGPEIERRLEGLRFDGGFDYSFGARRRLGIAVQELTPQLASYFGASDGVLVASVTDNSAAAKAGLKAGDVITAVNKSSVTSQPELVRLLDRAESDMVTLSVVREKKTMTLNATVERARVEGVRRPMRRERSI
jgi:serine protease Do